MTEEKKERTPWQKVVRGFWIALSAIGALLVFFIISMVPTENDDRGNIIDNQEYVVTVANGLTTYTYYCSDYARNLVNSSFILIDYAGNETDEIVITSSTFFVVSKNSDYKPEYIQDELEKTKKKKDPPKTT